MAPASCSVAQIKAQLFHLDFFPPQPDGKLGNSSIKCHQPSCIPSSKCLISQGFGKLSPLCSPIFSGAALEKWGQRHNFQAGCFLLLRHLHSRERGFVAWNKLISFHLVQDCGTFQFSFIIATQLEQTRFLLCIVNLQTTPSLFRAS